MSDTIIKAFSAIILAIVVFINSIGNFIGVGDIIPTQPEEEQTTVVEIEKFDEDAAAEFINFFNAETAKIVKNGSYHVERKVEYTSPVDVGAATNLINTLISSIDEDSNLDSIVGYYLGIGVKKADVPDGIVREYMLKETGLRVSDLASFSEEDNVYEFTIKNATNPKKNGATGFSNLTNDFVTEEEVKKEIANITTAITIIDSDVYYTGIKVSVKVEEGEITDISYSYNMHAEVLLNAGIEVAGTGATKTEVEFTNIEY